MYVWPKKNVRIGVRLVLCFYCGVAVCALCLFLAVPCFGLQSESVAFLGQSHLFFDTYYRNVHVIGHINAVARTRQRIQMHVSSTKIFFEISNEYGGILCMSYICELWCVIFVNN